MKEMSKIADHGTVLQLQSFSVNDGEGIRTVIFLPGCPLRCQWCANPETWTVQPKLAVFPEKCRLCGFCSGKCPNGIILPRERGEEGQCTACGRCVGACPNGALSVMCESITVDEIVQKVMRDAIFFRRSKGGVTFSGGEPTYQEELLRALVNRFFELGIDMDIETCGYFHWEQVKDIFAKLDHVFFDIKHMDSEQHKRLTGRDNKRILENCLKVAGLNIPMTIRIPLIMNINGTEQNLRSTAEFFCRHLPKATLELLPYHNLGKEKYLALGLGNQFHEFATPSRQEIEEASALISSYGIELVEYK